MIMEKIALFGTGRMLPHYLSCLHNIGLDADFLVDNDKAKQGRYLYGKQVISPSELKGMNCRIIISCNFVKEITEDLRELGIDDRILDIQGLLRKDADNKANVFFGCQEKTVIGKHQQVILDALDGIGWGGIEHWCYEVAQGLINRGYDCKVYGSDWQQRQGKSVEDSIIRFTLNRDDFWGTVKEIISDMETRLPIVLINNWTEHVLVAAYILKCKYPDMVDIITIVHNDNNTWYDKQKIWGDCASKIAGVSKKICVHLEQELRIPKEKIFYHENFYTGEISTSINVREKSEPIRLGWGARLEVLQKRADRLPEFIAALDCTGVNYELNIAGDGPCLEGLKQHVMEHQLEARVHLLGNLPREDMADFWRRQHIYVNISEFEGCSLAMLDAMAAGAVPVVSNVSGTDEFVIDSKTGYVASIGDYTTMAGYIEYLYNHEWERQKMAQEAQIIVRQKGNFSSYIDYVEELLKGTL